MGFLLYYKASAPWIKTGRWCGAYIIPIFIVTTGAVVVVVTSWIP